MFVILDTNHFTEFVNASAGGHRLKQRIVERGAEVFLCIIATAESLQGWLSFTHSKQSGLDELEGYLRLGNCIEALRDFTILPFDREAALLFHRLEAQRLRVGTMDLKIASICLAHEAMLLSRNLKDFEKVPGLQVENWLD